MRYRKLGPSDLEVSEISLGTAYTIADGIDTRTSETVIARALDLGVNLIDTANVYRHGETEEFLGRSLAARPRRTYMLATKVFFPMGPHDSGLSAVQIVKQCEASLRRLGMDFIDLYQCHRFDPAVELEETLAALTHLVRAGKVRFVGFSEWSSAQIAAASALPGYGDEKGYVPFVASQTQYSLLWRSPEKQLFKACADTGISQLAWAPLAEGILSGKYPALTAPPLRSRATNRNMNRTIGRFLDLPMLQATEALQLIAGEHGLSLAQLALAWVLRDWRVASAIVGVSRPEQLEENVRASGVTLSEDTLSAIQRVVGALPEAPT